MKYAPIFRLAAEKYLTPPDKIRKWKQGQTHSNYSCVAVNLAIKELVEGVHQQLAAEQMCRVLMANIGLDSGRAAPFDDVVMGSGYNRPSLEERQIMRFDWLQLVATIVEDAEAA